MIIRLTRKFKVPTEEAANKLKLLAENLIENSNKEDSSYPSIEFFKEEGIPIPEDHPALVRGEYLELKEEEFETKTSDYLCNIRHVQDFEQTESGTLIYYITDERILVEETIETIYKLIKK